MLVRLLEGNGDVRGQVVRHQAAAWLDEDVRGLAVGRDLRGAGYVQRSLPGLPESK